MTHQVAQCIAVLLGIILLWASPASAQLGSDFADCLGTDGTVVLTEVRQIGATSFAHIRLRTIAGPTPRQRIIEHSDSSHKGEQWILSLDEKGKPLTDIDDGCQFRTMVLRGKGQGAADSVANEPIEVFARRIRKERARYDLILTGSCTPKGHWQCPGVPKDQRTERELGAIVRELARVLPRVFIRCHTTSVPLEAQVDIHSDGHASIDPATWDGNATKSGNSNATCIDLGLHGIRFRVLDEDATTDSVTVPLLRKE